MEPPDELLLRQVGQKRRQYVSEPLFDLAKLVQQDRSDSFPGGGNGASHELGKASVSGLAVPHHLYRRADQGVENAFEIGLTLCRLQTVVEKSQSFAVEGLEPAGEDGPHQPLLGPEVVVDGGKVGTGLAGDGTK